MIEFLIKVILCGLASGYFLFIWFDGAKFFVEYLNLFSLDKLIPHLGKYNNVIKQGSTDSYLEYIQTFKDCFLTRLVTCPKCFNVFVSFFFCLFAFKYLTILPLQIFGTAAISILTYNLIKNTYERIN